MNVCEETWTDGSDRHSCVRQHSNHKGPHKCGCGEKKSRD